MFNDKHLEQERLPPHTAVCTAPCTNSVSLKDDVYDTDAELCHCFRLHTWNLNLLKRRQCEHSLPACFYRP